MTDYSETKSIDNIAAKCDPEIIPIFPTRYALTEEALFSIPKGKAISHPLSMTNLDMHELRRIRQGYLYIYAKRRHYDGVHSDQKGKWLIFRYETGFFPDENSNENRKDTQTGLSSGSYRFYKYEWENGAESHWTVSDSRIYPYAFVNKNVSEIDIAYSEYRWPNQFFLELEKNAASRKAIMTPVNLLADETTASTKLENLPNYVKEFSPTAQENSLGNAVRHTPFQPEDKNDILDCPLAWKHGRIVALQDPVGEMLDITGLHASVLQSRMYFGAAYQYPLVIGQLCKNLKASVDESFSGVDGVARRVFLGYPAHDDFEKEYQAIVDEAGVMDNMLASIARSYFSITARKGPNTIDAVLKVTKELIGGQISSKETFEVAEFASELLSRSLAGVTMSDAGSELMLHILKQTPYQNIVAHAASQKASTKNERLQIVEPAPEDIKTLDQAKDLSDYILSLADAYSKIQVDGFRDFSGAIKAPKFDYFIKVHAKEIAQIFSDHETKDKPRMRTKLEAAYNIKGGKKNVPLADFDVELRSNLKKYGLDTIPAHGKAYATFQHASDPNRAKIKIDISYYTTDYDSTTFNKDDSVTATGRQQRIDGNIELSSETQASVNNLRTAENVSNGIGAALALYTIIQTMKDWNQGAEYHTSIGNIVNDPKAVLIGAALDCSAAMQNIKNLNYGVGAKEFSHGISEKLFQRLFPSASGVRLAAGTTSTLPTSGLSNAGRSLSKVMTLGNVAGVVGIVLSAGNAYEGYMSGDCVKLGSGLSIAMGGTLMLLNPLVAASLGLPGLIIIIGGFIWSLQNYSLAEKWVKESFWGNSKFYWGEKTKRQEYLQQQINAAKVTANLNHPKHNMIKGFFQKEVEWYRQIVSPAPIITNNTASDKQFEIYYPHISDAKELYQSLQFDLKVNIYGAHDPKKASPAVFKISLTDRSEDYIRWRVEEGKIKVFFDEAHVERIERIINNRHHSNPYSSASPNGVEVILTLANHRVENLFQWSEL